VCAVVFKVMNAVFSEIATENGLRLARFIDTGRL